MRTFDLVERLLREMKEFLENNAKIRKILKKYDRKKPLLTLEKIVAAVNLV